MPEDDLSAEKVWFKEGDMWIKLGDGSSWESLWNGFQGYLTPLLNKGDKFDISGFGIHWEEIDEDICVCGLLAGHDDDARHRPNAETSRAILESRDMKPDEEMKEWMESSAIECGSLLDKMEWGEFSERLDDRWKATRWMARCLYTLEEVSFIWSLTESYYRGIIYVLKEDPYRHEKLIKHTETLLEDCVESFKLHSYSDAQDKIWREYNEAKVPTKEEVEEYDRKRKENRSAIDWDAASEELNQRIDKYEKEFLITLPFTAVLEPCEEGGFHGFVKEIEGAQSEGETIVETVANVQDALKAILNYQDASSFRK